MCFSFFSPSLTFPLFPAASLQWKNSWHPSLSLLCGSWRSPLKVVIYYRFGWAWRGTWYKTYSSPESYFGGIPTPLPNITAVVTIFILYRKREGISKETKDVVFSCYGFKGTTWTRGIWLILNVKFSKWKVLFHKGKLFLN